MCRKLQNSVTCGFADGFWKRGLRSCTSAMMGGGGNIAEATYAVAKAQQLFHPASFLHSQSLPLCEARKKVLVPGKAQALSRFTPCCSFFFQVSFYGFSEQLKAVVSHLNLSCTSLSVKEVDWLFCLQLFAASSPWSSSMVFYNLLELLLLGLLLWFFRAS